MPWTWGHVSILDKERARTELNGPIPQPRFRQRLRIRALFASGGYVLSADGRLIDRYATQGEAIRALVAINWLNRHGYRVISEAIQFRPGEPFGKIYLTPHVGPVAPLHLRPYSYGDLLASIPLLDPFAIWTVALTHPAHLANVNIQQNQFNKE